MKNNKGFTMVELLVAMAIMGLLIIMAFPTIRAIQANNAKSNFEEYGKSVVSASKLYVDSYEEDLFNLESNYGNADVTILDLYKKDLINKTGLNESDCSNSKVFILKYNNDYTYCLHLVCKQGGKTVYESNDIGKKKQCSNIETVKVNYTNDSEEKNDEIIKGTTNYNVKTPSVLGFSSPSSIKGWMDASSGKQYDFGAKITGPINNNISLRAVENEDPEPNSDPDPVIDPTKHYVKIKINVNGAKLAATHGSQYTIKDGYVYKNNDIYIHKIPYGDKLGINGLINFNNTNSLNIIYDYKHINKNDSGYYLAWNMTASGTGTQFNQNSQYEASKFCDASENDCEVTLYANWKDNTCTINYRAGTVNQIDAGAKFTNNKNNVQEVYTHGKILGSTANGMRNARGDSGYYQARFKDHVVRAGAEWYADIDDTIKSFDQSKKYAIDEICPNIKTKGNTNVYMKVKWLKQQSSFVLNTWKFKTKSCSGYTKNTTNINKMPYRQYLYARYECVCNYKVENSALDTSKVDVYYRTHSSSETYNCSQIELKSWENASSEQKAHCFPATAKVYYRPTTNGYDACNQTENSDGTKKFKINEYVYKICTKGDLYKNKDKMWFHGAYWYWTTGNASPAIGKVLTSNQNARSEELSNFDEIGTGNTPNVDPFENAKYVNSSIKNTCIKYCKFTYGNPRTNENVDMADEE